MGRIPNFIRGGHAVYTSIYDNPEFKLKEPGKTFRFCDNCPGRIYPGVEHRCKS